MKRILFRWALATVLFVSALPAHAAELRLIAWNIEGGGFEDAEVATITAGMDSLGHADIWGLSEVTAAWVDDLRAAAGSNYHAELGTQASDRLLVLVNLNRFDVTGSEEITTHNPTANRRPPLAVTVRERSNGTQLVFVVNHLTRGTGDDPRRSEEAEALREWARQQNLPIIAAGDFNFDWSIHDYGQTRSAAFDEMIEDNVFEWSVPATLRRTQCNPNFYSVLDFVFVAGDAKLWPHETTIINTPCIDNAQTADHRPIETIINLPE